MSKKVNGQSVVIIDPIFGSMMSSEEESSLEKIKDNVTCKNMVGIVMYSIQVKYKYRVELLKIGLEMGMNLEELVCGSQQTIFYFAIFYKDVKMASSLIKAGVNIHKKWQKLDYLHLAVACCSDTETEIIKILMEAGLKNNENMDYHVVTIALLKDKIEICKNLIKGSMIKDRCIEFLKFLVEYFLSGTTGLAKINKGISSKDRYKAYLDLLRCYFESLKVIDMRDVIWMTNIAQKKEEGLEVMRTMMVLLDYSKKFTLN